MKEGKNEFLGLLCNLYLVILLAALPLYTGDGYCQLGDTKYTLFRNLSFLCLGGWLLAGMPGRVRSVAEYLRAWKERCKGEYGTEAQTGLTGDGAVRSGRRGMETAGQKWRSRSGAGRKQAVFSSVDFAMMLYGICVIFSAVCSSYGELAWTGYEGWYMGAISQILFIGIYFFISRQYDGAAWPIYLGEAAFFLVTLLGLLHRLGIDPLGLMGNWNSGDWEYSHMLSTLGNINWLCGYYSVATAFVIVHFLRDRRRWLRVALYMVSVSAFVLLLLQGSQSGLLILGACVAVCFFLGGQQSGAWGKMLLLLAGTFFFMPLMEVLMRLRGSKAAVVADGNIFAFIGWYVWILAAVICLFLYLLLERKGDVCEENPAEENDRQEEIRIGEEIASVKSETDELQGSAGYRKEEQKSDVWKRVLLRSKAENGCIRRALRRVATAFLGVAIVLAGVLFWRGLDDSFGSGRGFLWRIAVESFIEADAKDKLLGAGPDCYAESVFNRLGADTDVWKGEHWEGAVFTNAHNEILSQLCNVGILGTVSYLAVFLAGMCRYGCASEKKYGYGQREERLAGYCMGGMGLLVLAMYGIHSLVSFQQVLNAPLLFLALGLCEAEMRRKGQRTGSGNPKAGEKQCRQYRQ